MKTIRPHAPSFLAGSALALLAFVTMGQKPMPAATSWEYRIVDDVSPKELGTLAAEGWEYSGYLGQGVKGNGNDETLWRRSVK